MGLVNKKRNEVKATTYDGLYNTIQHRIKPYPISKISVNLITPADVQKFLTQLIDDKYSQATIEKTYNALNNCFKLAVRDGELTKNPMTHVSKPKEDHVVTKKKEIKFFTAEDV